MAVVSKHDAIVSMSASSSSSFPFGILLFGIVLFSVFCGQSPLLRCIAFVFSLLFRLLSLPLSLSLSDTNKKPSSFFLLPSSVCSVAIVANVA